MVHRFKREELYELVWSKPMSKLARELSVSDRAIAKACERVEIPTPGLGYWAKLQHGKMVKRSLLPPPIPRTPGFVQISPGVSQSHLREFAPEVQEKIAHEFSAESRIIVPKKLSKRHPIVRAWLELDRQRSEAGPKLSREHRDQSPIGARLERRRLRILGALFEALEKRGHKVVANPQNQYEFECVVDEEKIDFGVVHPQKQFKENLQPEKMRNPLNAALGITSRIELRPTGMLAFKIHSWIGVGIRKQWRDTARKPLEDQLNSIVAGLLFAAAMIRRHRMEREEEQRRLLTERIERERQEESRRKEAERYQGLLQRVDRWLQAANVRAYVDAVRTAAQTGRAQIDPERLKTWATWALAYADQMDPIAVGNTLAETLFG